MTYNNKIIHNYCVISKSFQRFTKTPHLTNLEELSFLTVFALPKASRMGLACSSCLSSSPWDTQRSLGQLPDSHHPPTRRTTSSRLPHHPNAPPRFFLIICFLSHFQQHNRSSLTGFSLSSEDQDQRTHKHSHNQHCLNTTTSQRHPLKA